MHNERLGLKEDDTIGGKREEKKEGSGGVRGEKEED